MCVYGFATSEPTHTPIPTPNPEPTPHFGTEQYGDLKHIPIPNAVLAYMPPI